MSIEKFENQPSKPENPTLTYSGSFDLRSNDDEYEYGKVVEFIRSELGDESVVVQKIFHEFKIEIKSDKDLLCAIPRLLDSEIGGPAAESVADHMRSLGVTVSDHT